MQEIKNLKKVIIIVACISIGAFIIPIISFCLNFYKNGISNDPKDWGNFGDYIGGVVGTNLSLIAIIISFASIYLSMKMSLKLQKNEIKFNEEMSRKEKEIIEKQNKPFLYFDLNLVDENTGINICNYGAGALIIKKIQLEYLGSELFNNFYKFFGAKLKNTNTEVIKIAFNTASYHVLPPNGIKNLLRITPVKQLNDDYYSELSIIREYLKDCVIKVEYEDIFENKFSHSQKLSFLGN